MASLKTLKLRNVRNITEHHFRKLSFSHKVKKKKSLSNFFLQINSPADVFPDNYKCFPLKKILKM